MKPPPAIAIRSATPDPALVHYVEHLLDLVKSGEVVAVAVAAEHVGRSIGTCYSGDIDVYRMLGAIESLKRRIMQERDA